MGQSRDRLILLIGLFKLFKAALLIGTGVAALVVLPEQLAAHLQAAEMAVGAAPGRGLLARLTERLLELDHNQAQRLGVLALAYAAVFLTEGTGLLLRKRWAEWLTVVVTGSFIPFEVYELWVRFGAGKVVTLILNVAIVIYLTARRLRDRGDGRQASPMLTHTTV